MEISSEIIAERRNVRYGSNGFYDIRLLREGADALLIEVALSFFFRFIPFGADPRITWTQQERDFFMAEWLRQIPAAWNQRNHTTLNGSNLSIAFICSVQQVALNTQWQANVMKLESRNAYRTSAVWLDQYPENYDAKFDSNDDVLKSRDRRQTAMIHEFGHMLGLGDEYKREDPNYNDKDSIMNIGAQVRGRHLAHFVNWATQNIDSLSNGEQFQPKYMKALKLITEAKTKEEEIEAVEAWLEGEGPDEGVYFIVRKRDTGTEIPIEEILLYNIEDIEVEFRSDVEPYAEVDIWQPKSIETLEMLLVE